MLASGILFISLGLPIFVLGIYFRKEAGREAEKVASEKQKTRAKKDNKKSKRSKKDKGKERDKDQVGKERGTSGGGSMIIGGLITTLIGVAFIVAHFTK